MAIILIRNIDYLAFKLYVEFCLDLTLNVFHKLKHVTAGCSAAIDEKSGMLFGHLSAAYRVALEPCILDKLTRKMPYRALEGATRVRIFKRLLFAARGHIFAHQVEYFLGVTLM